MALPASISALSASSLAFSLHELQVEAGNLCVEEALLVGAGREIGLDGVDVFDEDLRCLLGLNKLFLELGEG